MIFMQKENIQSMHWLGKCYYCATHSSTVMHDTPEIIDNLYTLALEPREPLHDIWGRYSCDFALAVLNAFKSDYAKKMFNKAMKQIKDPPNAKELKDTYSFVRREYND